MQYSVSNGNGTFVIDVTDDNRDGFIQRMEDKGYHVEEASPSEDDIDEMTRIKAGDQITEVTFDGYRQTIFYGGLENDNHILICESDVFALDGKAEVTPYVTRKAFGEHFKRNIYKITLPCGIIHYEACTDDEMDEKKLIYKSLNASIHLESRNT